MNLSLVDTHAHLDDEKYSSDRKEVIKRAVDAGVKYLINIGTDIESNEYSLNDVG